MKNKENTKIDTTKIEKIMKSVKEKTNMNNTQLCNPYHIPARKCVGVTEGLVGGELW